MVEAATEVVKVAAVLEVATAEMRVVVVVLALKFGFKVTTLRYYFITRHINIIRQEVGSKPGRIHTYIHTEFRTKRLLLTQQ